MLSLDRVRQLEPGRKVGEKQVRKLLLYINRFQKSNRIFISQNYFGFTTNVEFYQLVIMDGDGKFRSSTPRALLYPGIRNADEEGIWTKAFSEIAGCMFCIINDRLSEPD